MSELEKAMMEDSQTMEATNEQIEQLSELVEAQLELEDRLKKAEQFAKEVKEKLVEIQSVAIPALMDEVGFKEIKLKNGRKVTIREDVRASMRADKIGECVAWLEQQGIGDIVKDEVKVNFGRGDIERSKMLLAYCNANGLKANEKLSIHPQTLKATVKEQMARGIEFPEEYFSIFPDRKTIIK